MDRWMGKVAVVTGASSGIGLHTAEALVRHGMVVIGLARRRAKMEEDMKNVRGKGKFHAFECDVSQEDIVVKVFDQIKTKFGTVHVMINNAGGMMKGATMDSSTADLRKIIDVNLMGLIYCTKQAINLMKEGKHEGHVINIGSILGQRIVHLENFKFNVYPAAKFAVRAFTETMKNELRAYPIRFTHITPGIVKTEFLIVGGADKTFREETPQLNPEDVADAIVYVIGTKPHVHIPELAIRHMDDHYK